ncbi:MAG TPA: amino acid permease, partial [Mariniflexile sp.]|nr:amino acid permease [Mariniflexile sp.]
ALALFTLPVLQGSEFQNTLLIKMGDHVGGNWIATLVSIDAFLVLSGAVLTSFVGVSGLLERMTLDRILPPFFLKRNSRGSSYRIIIMFLILCISVLIITNGDVSLLAGVYTISFLSVMVLFGIGNILLKVRRNQLPRPEKATWGAVLLAITAVIIALVGNITMPPKPGNPSNFSVFLKYFIPTIIFIIIMLNRIVLLNFLLNVIHSVFDPVRSLVLRTDKRILSTINKINSQEFVFFTKGDNIATLNKVMLYITRNEHTKKLKIVLALDKDDVVPKNLPQEIDFLDREYPDIKVEFVVEQGKFSPELIRNLSKKWNIPINFMFIGSPSDKFPYRVQDLGGVRLII